MIVFALLSVKVYGQSEGRPRETPTRTPPGLEFLYRVEFAYPEEWAISVSGSRGTESQHFFIAEGKVEGTIRGRLRGANHPRRRTDETFVPDFQGVIEDESGLPIYFDYQGYGRAYPVGRRQIVVSATHLSEAERYRRLNDALCVGIGEVRTNAGGGNTLVIDFYEVLWVQVEQD